MILTVTLNPSIDISYPLDELTLDTVNRVSEVKKTAGGKGLNVTRVLSEIGDNVTATGFIGGKLGDFLTSRLDQNGIQHRFFKIHGETRNCIAILHEGLQTEVLEAGPMIDQDEADGFLNHFRYLSRLMMLSRFRVAFQRGLKAIIIKKSLDLLTCKIKRWC